MLKKIVDSIVSLLFPEVCASCGTLLLKGEETVCTTCRCLLPKTKYELNPDNPLMLNFLGQMPFNAVTAEFFFSKGGHVQTLIHGLKYHGLKENGIFLGQEIGKSIKQSPVFQGIDYIIPVPLHPKKQKIRGYNQSMVIAQGIREETGIQIAGNCLIRNVFTSTQTKKSREERWQNVRDIFDVMNTGQLEGKHVLLVDDVLTTGATLMAAGKALYNVKDIKVSVATAACVGG